MLIKKITMFNFRQYKSLREIEFSCDHEKMLRLFWVIILAERLHSYKHLIGVYMVKHLLNQKR